MNLLLLQMAVFITKCRKHDMPTHSLHLGTKLLCIATANTTSQHSYLSQKPSQIVLKSSQVNLRVSSHLIPDHIKAQCKIIHANMLCSRVETEHEQLFSGARSCALRLATKTGPQRAPLRSVEVDVGCTHSSRTTTFARAGKVPAP